MPTGCALRSMGPSAPTDEKSLGMWGPNEQKLAKLMAGAGLAEADDGVEAITAQGHGKDLHPAGGRRARKPLA